MEGPHRILVVDDDPEALDVLGEFFVDEGYIVETALDGATALDKLDGFRADLVVTDFEMPGMNGLQLIRRIQDRYPGRPTLLVTARSDDWLEHVYEHEHEHEATCDEGFPIACLHKPVNLEDLILAIKTLIPDEGAPMMDASAC